MDALLRELIRVSGNKEATIAIDGLEVGKITAYTDSGSYMLNALISGSIFKGLPNNKVIGLAGEEATGKTYFALGIVQQFLSDHPEATAIFFESESALTPEMLSLRNIDRKRLVIFPVGTIQEFHFQAMKILEMYLALPQANRTPMIFTLDSLGNLPTTKEVEEALKGSGVKDMTRQTAIKSVFRTLTQPLARAGIPFIVTNHTYAVIGSNYPAREMSGGGGLKYAASNILYLSKRKEKDGTEIIGNVIHCKNAKSRLTVENKTVDVLLNYQTGLHRYYGLLNLGERHGLFTRVSTKWKVGESAAFEKHIYRHPERFFTPDVLEALDSAAGKEFLYGGNANEPNEKDQNPEAEI